MRRVLISGASWFGCSGVGTMSDKDQGSGKSEEIRSRRGSGSAQQGIRSAEPAGGGELNHQGDATAQSETESHEDGVRQSEPREDDGKQAM